MRIRPLRLVSSTLLIVTLVAMVALSFGVSSRRWQAVPVLSGSMEPAIAAGAIAFSVSIPREDVTPGDVLVFRSPQGARAVTVHRVVTATRESGRTLLTTKGDANSVADSWGEFAVTSPQVWRVTGSLAGVGRIILWARTPAAQLVGFVALVVCAAIFLSDWRLSRRRRLWAHRFGDRDLATDTSPEPAPELTDTAVAAVAEHAPTPATPLDPAPRPERLHVAVRPSILAAADDAGDRDEPEALVNLTRRLDQIDPAWHWEPYATDADGSPLFERDEHGRPNAVWLRLHIDRTSRTGLATRTTTDGDIRQSLVIDALSFAAAGLDDRPRTRPSNPLAAKARRSRAGVLVTSLLLPVLLVGVGPGAAATFTDGETDTLTVGTRDLDPPQLTSAETSDALGSCEVTLTWVSSPTAGVDGYVFDRQPIAIGTAESDALGVTSPDPTGPWETVLRVEGGATTTAVDTLPSDQLATASRFHYRSRATVGAWESGNSNVVEAQALGTCVELPAPAPLPVPAPVPVPAVELPTLLTPA